MVAAPPTQNRLDFLCRHPPRCPACNHVQVQLVDHWVDPAQWRCRMCKHPFHFEPEPEVSLANKKSELSRKLSAKAVAREKLKRDARPGVVRRERTIEVSLPDDLMDWIDAERDQLTSRSQFVAGVLRAAMLKVVRGP